MTGSSNGVTPKLKGLNKILLSCHCICQRLELACADASDDVSLIKDVEANLNHLWKLFENSSKILAAYIKTQEKLGEINLSNKARKVVSRKTKKACLIIPCQRYMRTLSHYFKLSTISTLIQLRLSFLRR